MPLLELLSVDKSFNCIQEGVSQCQERFSQIAHLLAEAIKSRYTQHFLTNLTLILQAMEVEEPFTTKQPERNKNNKSDLSLSSFPELDFQPTNSYMRGGDVLSSRADKKKTFCAPAVGRGANFMASDNISDWAKPSLFAKERFSVLV